MSVQFLFARISGLVLEHSMGKTAVSKRAKSSRQQTVGGNFSHLVEEMEQRILLAGTGATEEPEADVTVWDYTDLIAGDQFPAYDGEGAADPDLNAQAATPSGFDPDNPLSNSYVFDEADIFSLHSHSTATKIIYLDFDGHITNDPSNLSDNTGWNGGQRIDSRPYDLDGDIHTFNDTELRNIYDIWRQVSEDFRPFNIDVTTEEPSDLSKLRRDPIAGNIIDINTIVGNGEDDGDQTQANETNLVPGSTARAIGLNIGDGPFGATSGDYDWFAVRGVNAGSVISVDIDAEEIGSLLNSYVTIYDAFGNVVADNDNVDGADSALLYEAESFGDYFVVVSGSTVPLPVGNEGHVHAIIPNGTQGDPLDSSTGTGVHSIGDYNIDISLDIVDEWGIRVVIAGDSGEWLPPFIGVVGGIAFLNSFNSGVDVPTFVFQSNLGGVNGISEASSHEVGHTLGLHHDGLFNHVANRTTQEYYPGHGSGVNSWGPIMGASFGRTLTQWSQGEYTKGSYNPLTGHYAEDANNSTVRPHAGEPSEDDLQIIATGHGFGYRQDDHGDTIATASDVNEVTPSFYHNTGIITDRNDYDWFKFTVPQLNEFEVTGIDLRVTPAAFAPNLDLAIDLFDSTGHLITFSSPEDSLDAAITFVLVPGEEYFFRVDGVAYKNTHIGYTDYGSLGYFEVDLDYFEPVIFNAQTFSVLENVAVGTPVGTLVSGQAPIDAIIYEIIGGNTNNTFAVDPLTGEITVNDNLLLDFETNPVFQLNVRVTDQSRSVVYNETAIITINVLDGAESPIIVDQTFTVPENSLNGTTFGNVAATDPDPARILTYAIIGGTGQTVFAIDPNTGELSVITPAALNFEITPSFDLLVEVTNDAPIPLGTSATITVNIGDVNEIPVLNDIILPALPEHSVDGTVVGTITGTDPDNGQNLVYSIIAGNPDKDSRGNTVPVGFAIDPATGEITVSNTLAFNFNVNPTVRLTVQLTDDGVPVMFDTADVTFSLTDQQGAPVVEDQLFEVAEFSPVGTSVGVVFATDPDPNDIPNITFDAILEGNTGGTFALDPNTGELTVADNAQLDLTLNTTFLLLVRVHDNAAPDKTDNAFITVNVRPFNNSPVLDDVTFEIEERKPAGTVVGTVVATDVDVIDTLVYTIVSGNDLGAFVLDPNTGVITTTDPDLIDFSRNKEYQLVVRATDDGFPIKNDTGVVTIVITEFNGPVQLSEQEQLILELINRARHNPVAEAARLGLNPQQTAQFLFLGSEAVQPLAPNQYLKDASIGHTDDMIARTFISHVNPDGDSFDVRAFNAGYDWNALAENIELLAGSGLSQARIQQLYDQMILDAVNRLNILGAENREFGAGIADGLGNTIVTTLIGREDATGPFLTGVVYRDASDNSATDDDFYSLGEAVGAAFVTATNRDTGESFTREIGDSGGFSLRVPAGTYDLLLFGGDLGTKTFEKTNVVVGSENVKVDFELSQFTTSEIAGFVNGNWWVSSKSSGSWETSRWSQWSNSTLLKTLSGDFNGDGVDDIAGWAPDGNWYIGIAQPGGFFTTSKWTKWRTNDVKEVHVGDFNGDGRDDIIGLFKRGAKKGDWWVARSNGAAFVAQKWGTYGNYDAINGVGIGDFDGIGRDDVAVLASNGKWWNYLSTGSSFVARNWTTWDLSQGVDNILVGDFDNNGKEDIAGLFGTGNSRDWNVALSTGNQYVNRNWGNWTYNSSLEHVVSGDFNGDGATDIAGLVDGDTWRVGLANTNQFNSANWGTWAFAATGVVDVNVGDSNGDGLADIFGRSTVDGWWYTANSDGTAFNTEKIIRWSETANWQNVHVNNFDVRDPLAGIPDASIPAPDLPVPQSDGGNEEEEQDNLQALASRAVANSGSSQTGASFVEESADEEAQQAGGEAGGNAEEFEVFGDSNLLDLLFQV